mgnify:FL=1
MIKINRATVLLMTMLGLTACGGESSSEAVHV